MRWRDTALILGGWVGLCLASGSLITLIGQALPA